MVPPSLSPGFIALIGVWILLSLALLLWYHWSLSRLFPRIGLPSWYGWVPGLAQWRLLQRAGLPGWLVLLAIPTFGIALAIGLVMAAHRLNEEVGLSPGMTVLAIILPPLWVMILTQSHPQPEELAPHSAQPAPTHSAHLDSAWAPPQRHIHSPAPPPSWGSPSTPADPLVGYNSSSTTPPPPPLHPLAQAPASPPPPPVTFQPPPQSPASSPIDDEDHGTIVMTTEGDDESIDSHTVIVNQPTVRWVLEFGGEEYVLSDDVIIGRNPTSTETSAALKLDDPSRVLSKSHARLRLVNNQWLIEDLGSTNGTVVHHTGFSPQPLEPHTELEASEELELGPLPAKINKVEHP